MPQRGECDCWSSRQPCTRCGGSPAAEECFGARAGAVIDAELGRVAIGKNVTPGEYSDPQNRNAHDDAGRADRVRNSRAGSSAARADTSNAAAKGTYDPRAMSSRSAKIVSRS